MQLRSGRRFATQQQGGARRGRPRRRTTDDSGADDGDGAADRISALPDELLLDVLARLRSLREAARTSVLARAWRGIWTRLPGDLSFYVPDPASPVANGARARFHRSKHNHLHISVRKQIATPHHLTLLLRIAAQIKPEELEIMLRIQDGNSSSVPFELPCFERTSSIEMYIYDQLNFTLPPAGVFASLETLDLWYCTAGVVGDLLARCPRLRRLKLFGAWGVDVLAIHSASLEELTLGIHGKGDRMLRHVDIVTPVLKKFVRQWCGPEELTVSYSMPVVEEVSMPYGPSSPVGFGHKWRLNSLTMGKACVNIHEQPVRALSLEILYDHVSPAERSFTQEIARLLGVINFSTLELKLHTKGHAFGALVFELLQIPTIQRLKVVLLQNLAPQCPENCYCNQVTNWGNQCISLTDLEVAVIEGFRGVDHEIGFLKLLFRSAPILKRMTVQLSIEVSLSNRLFQKLQAIFQGNASVECDVYDKCDKKISFA